MTDQAHSSDLPDKRPAKYNPTIQDLREHILAALDIPGFYAKYLVGGARLHQVTSDGWSDRVLCPIHNDTKTPNFFVNVKSGYFRCHACGAQGSVFDFWMTMNGMSIQDKTNFHEAIKALANECNVNIGEFKKNFKPAPGLPPKRVDPTEKRELIPSKNDADANDAVNAPIEPELIQLFHDALGPEHYKYLTQKRGLKKRTIDAAMIGWDKDSPVKIKDTQNSWENGRYTIPIFNKVGEARNIRKYSGVCDPAFKMINHVINKKKPGEKSYGKPPRLLNMHKISTGNYDNIVLCEGEWDCLLLQQYLEDMGLQTWLAVSGTHGANKFMAEWLQVFQHKNIYLCLDCDDEGKAAATNIASKYLLAPLQAGLLASVKIIHLPLEGTKSQKDITDYFIQCNYTGEDFLKLCTSTAEVITGGIDQDEATEPPLMADDFVTAIKDRRYIDRRVTVPITISGHSSKIYHAIREYKVTKCAMEDGECCSENAGTRLIPYGHPLFIDSCMSPESRILQSVACMACQKDQKPGAVKVKPTKKVVMEEYFAHQVVRRLTAEEDEHGVLRNNQELVEASVYFLQPHDRQDIKPQNYSATGFIRTHPRTSMATFFIEKMVAMEEDWRKFDVAQKDNHDLIKHIKENFSIDDITSEITQHVTRIYESDDILFCVLLTYLSPLEFKFNGQYQRGWINSAIIGDSGTGKSITYSRIAEWIGQGDLFSILSGSRTGLLYAITKKNDEWRVSIGRYVHATRTIIAVDETDKADRDDIRKMAVSMQTGWLEIAQVATGGYETKTRTLFLMNPKRGNNQAATISDFTHGCDALPECFDPMFIRRLDLAVFTVSRKAFNLYNQVSTGKQAEPRLSAKMFRALVNWAWTRKRDQIVWTEEATRFCLDQTTELSKIYGDVDHVPLVNPNDFREKLARLSVAYAVLARNFTDDLQSVVVEVSHVQAVSNIIHALYSSSACGLKQKSKQCRQRNTLEGFEKIKGAFEAAIQQEKTSPDKSYSESNLFCQFLLLLQQLHVTRKRDLCDQLGASMRWVQNRLSVLQGFNLLECSRAGYRITRKFNLFMQEWAKDPKVEAMIDQVYKKIGENAMKVDTSREWFEGMPADKVPEYDPFYGSNPGDNDEQEYRKQEPAYDDSERGYYDR